MRILLTVIAVLVIGLSFPLPARAQSATFTSTFTARWNLTHGKYLVDIGQYLEALEAFDTAIEMTGVDDIRTEALLQKAAVLSLFLDATDDAVAVYDDLLARYPNSTAAEPALFRAGMVLFDRGQYGRAAGYFARYLQDYPQGPSRGSAEFLLQQSRSKAGKTVPLAPPPPSITEVRVRILKGQGHVSVESEGTLSMVPGATQGRAIELTARDGLVSAGGQAGTREVTVRADQPLHIRAGRMVRHYRGSLTVSANADTLQIINRVGIEEYLYGVVTKESVASWPAEALKAQAIASRTYALYQAQHRQDRAYDMVDDEGSQVYGGIEGESASGRRAVDGTRATVLAYHGRPIYAMFTANAGWYTGDPKFIFDQPLPYLTAVPDPYSPQEEMGRWTRTYSGADVRRSLSDVLGTQLGKIRDIQPVVTCPSGRIVRVNIVDDRGSHEMRTRPTLGRALKLPEILVDVRHEGDRFVFTGGGFGHGVGLSQWGAKGMADKGFSAKEILAFYYRGAEMMTLAH